MSFQPVVVNEENAPHFIKGDEKTLKPDTKIMTDITREEFNAKLETIEVKMDARVQAVSSKIDGFLTAQAERDRRLDLVLDQITRANEDTKSSISSMKTTLIVTAVSTVLAIVIGIASFNTALTSNMISAFQLGLSRAEQSAKSKADAPDILPPPATKISPQPESAKQ